MASSPPADVMVLPFTSMGPSDGAVPDWVGAAVQQNLSADLGRFHLQPAASPPATDATVDRSAARYLIKGSYQSTDGTVRFSGEIIDAAGNNVVGGLSATGPVRDLFGLEDELSMQAVHQLTRLLHPVAAPATPPAAPAVAEIPAIPTESYDGSSLQAYVNSNLPPSNNYWDQVAASRDRQMYGTYPAAYGYGYGGYGYGLPIGVGGYYGGFYPGTIGIPYTGGYFGGAYGGFGYGGFGSFGRGFHGGFAGHGGFGR
jgi:TolB-like protein